MSDDLDRDDPAPDRYRHLPEPIRISQATIAYAVLPVGPMMAWGDAVPCGDGGHGDGD